MLQRRSKIKEEWWKIKKPTHSPAEESYTESLTKWKEEGYRLFFMNTLGRI